MKNIFIGKWKLVFLSLVSIISIISMSILCWKMYPLLEKKQGRIETTENMSTKRVRFAESVEIFEIPTRKHSFEYYL